MKLNGLVSHSAVASPTGKWSYLRNKEVIISLKMVRGHSQKHEVMPRTSPESMLHTDKLVKIKKFNLLGCI